MEILKFVTQDLFYKQLKMVNFENDLKITLLSYW